MTRALVILGSALLASSCADFPRDPEGTLKRVRSDGKFLVGVVSPLAPNSREIESFLGAVGSAASARPVIVSGDSEPLLSRLKEGELDLVIGRFEKKSPWSASVEIGPPLRTGKRGKTEFVLAPVMRNGENAWVALIEQKARDSGAQAK